MAWSADEDARLRTLVDDIRMENPHLARVILRGRRHRMLDKRWAFGCVALLGAVVLMLVGGGIALVCAIVSDTFATILLRPFISGPRRIVKDA